MTAIIQCHEVKQRLAEGAVVIDVMTPEDYAACHVAGAGGNHLGLAVDHSHGRGHE